jgi:hypothetical protein
MDFILFHLLRREKEFYFFEIPQSPDAIPDLFGHDSLSFLMLLVMSSGVLNY